MPDQSITGSLPTITLALLPNEVIERDMRERGFPELERCWREFAATGREAATIRAEAVSRKRAAHMQLGFGAPTTVATAAVAAGAGATHFGRESVRGLAAPLPELMRPAAPTMYALNFAALFCALAVGIQRYLLHPYGKIMAQDSAAMLRWSNFRLWFEGTERSREFRTKLNELDVSSTWDDTNFIRAYRLESGQVIAAKEETSVESIQRVLREVLGYKDNDPAKRKFVPGRLTPALLSGKASVTEFVSLRAEELKLVRAGTIDRETGCVLIRELRDKYSIKGGEAQRFLNSELQVLEQGKGLGEGMVRANVWMRNPWFDLTSQKEFFSSASLRGRSIFEMGSKGRLGNFGYLHNPAISCLDFSNRKGRCVRARLLAAQTSGSNGAKVSILFVDGVEGTNSLRPEIIKFAIEEFARACNFKAIAYNANVHNRTPKLFVDHLSKTGSVPRELSIEAIDTSTREYLDAFGLPIQPFEYASPKGRVLAHITQLDGAISELGSSESLVGRAKRFLQHWGLYIFFADGVAFGTLAAAQVSTVLAGAILLGSGVGLAANEWYKQRSRRALKTLM